LKTEHIKACGGVVYRLVGYNVHVLLIFRRGYWDIPKGKLEDNESIEMCAAREVSEETGIEIPMIIQSLGETSHTFFQDGISIKKTTHWFSMVSRSTNFVAQQDEDIEQVDWVELKLAKKLVGFQNLRTVLSRFDSSIKVES
jgi:8-oxo-dGTP pyrophosphatase MutT (NUDIX family)